MGIVVIYNDLHSSANNLGSVIEYLKTAVNQLDSISEEIESSNKKHGCFNQTDTGIDDLKRDFANYITEVTFLQQQCTKAATAFENAEGKNAKVTDEMRTVINDATIMLGKDKITNPDITAYNKREDFDKDGNKLAEDPAVNTSQTWKNTFVEGNDKMVSINSDLSTKAESIIDPEKEAEKQEEPEEQKPDEEPKTEPEEPKQDYNPPKGTTPSEEKTEGDKQEKAEGDKQKKSEEETKNPKTDEGNKPKEETTTKTETSKDSSKEPKKEEPSTVTPPSETKTETTTTTTTPTTPTEPQQETYVPPAETNNNNNYNNYSNETPINNNVETGEETMTTEPEIPKGSDETAPSPEVPDDEIVKGNEYTKIPTSDTPIETKHKSGNGFIPIAAGLSAAAAAGIGAKVYMDRKNNNDNGEDDFTSEELNSDESTISNQIDNNNTQEDTKEDNTTEEDNINNDDYSAKPEKYGARNNNEIADLQQ